MEDNGGTTNDSALDLKLNYYEGETSSSAAAQEGVVIDQDHLLPIASVGRLMKHILPPNAKISKEAKEVMQECVSEFISFVTGEASDKCRKEKRKTLNGDDVCWALASLGFDNFADTTTRYLLRYRDLENERAANQINKAGGDDNEGNNTETTTNDPAVVSDTTATINFYI